MDYDFDTLVSRRGTDCVKWDLPAVDGVLPLWVADMDFRSAPAIVDALRRRVDEGVFGYAQPPASWHESLARWLARRHGWGIEPDSILDTTGVIPALAATIRAFCNPGDKVIIQPPVYSCFHVVIPDQGCEIVENRLLRVPVPDGLEGDFSYEMDFEDLERKASDTRVKLLILSNPHNPVGRAWRADELRRVGEICLRHGVFVASDEIHADLQMPGSRHVPFASLGGDFAQGSATFWSASKAFNLAGLQTAAVVCANDAVRARIRHALRVNRTGELNPFGFIASKVAWDTCAPWLDALRTYLHGNYSALRSFIRGRLPMLRVAKLEATYLAWVDFTSFGVPSAELARRLERDAKVKFHPGDVYGGEEGSTFLRINLASPRAMLLEALERTADFLLDLKGEHGIRMGMDSRQRDNRPDVDEKLKQLRERLRGIGSAAVAFSSGVDSTFLLRVAHEELGDRVVAVTARSHTFPKRELDEAAVFCRAEGIRHEVMDSEELDIPGFAENPPDRCYHCKRELFSKLLAFAHDNGLAAVLEGSNIDDDGDYRPGQRAIRELGIVSPLHEVGLTKAEIRALSKAMGLPTAGKPSFACLASRFPYGERITAAGLARVEKAEQWLLDADPGLRQVRVRSHGDMARIEVQPDAIPRLSSRATEIVAAFKGFGFAYTTLDLQGYRTGSMNEVLSETTIHRP